MDVSSAKKNITSHVPYFVPDQSKSDRSIVGTKRSSRNKP
jgi:hypothetical protein